MEKMARLITGNPPEGTRSLPCYHSGRISLVIGLFRFWWTFSDRVDASAYRAHGLALVLVKYGGDAAPVALATGRLWSPLDYLSSVPRECATLQDAPSWLFPALATCRVPFCCAGI